MEGLNSGQGDGSADPLGREEGRRVYIETFGCQMNDSDSGRILGFLKDIGYIRTGEPALADLILINTCSIRDKAEQKVYSTLGRFKGLKKENPGLMIGVSGCVAQQEGRVLLKRAPYLDLVFGTHNIHRIGDLLKDAKTRGKGVVATDLYGSIGEGEYGPWAGAVGGRAFVSIMRGCDNYCSYCVVPYTRGREASRKSADIIAEIEGLVERGAADVTLLGQNVNSYGRGLAPPDVSFPGLLRLAAGVEGVKRVRFLTSHPKDISEELICLFGEEPKLCGHMHLPVQSGSEAVLGMMGRGYTRDEYLAKAGLLRRLYPDMSITTDVIVGFPGESDADFEATMDLIREFRFDNVFSFMYSPRPGTPASAYSGHVPAEVKSARLSALQEVQRGITLGRNRSLVGRTVEVLIEGPSKAGMEEAAGRTGCNRVVNFPWRSAEAGGLHNVKITEALPNSLRAVPAA
jgi:tRNA-2-methylthio-N6-dimethylallyladenosine synthase